MTPRQLIRVKQSYLREQNKRQPECLTVQARDCWPPNLPPRVFQVWRNRRFLVQGYVEDTGMVRLTVCRTTMLDNGRMQDGITWDELQVLKREAGYGDYEAVEVYPRDGHIVDVANMRHLWVFPHGEGMPFTWNAVDPDLVARNALADGNQLSTAIASGVNRGSEAK